MVGGIVLKGSGIGMLIGWSKRLKRRREVSWCGSSVWLEYRPVTPGVAGSSPVRTARMKPQKSGFFC